MASYYIDWNCHLLPGIHETLTDFDESASAMRYMYSYQQIRTFSLMPTFWPFRDSVSIFTLKRDRMLQGLVRSLEKSFTDDPIFNEQPPRQPIRLLCGACVAIEQGCHTVDRLDKLTVSFNGVRYLPIILPVSDFADWIDYEINRLLYRAGLKLWFTSFELACMFYPDEIIQKLCRISGAVFQFGYRSLEDVSVRRVIKILLHNRATVLLGTSLDRLEKSYRYDLAYSLELAKTDFTPKEFQTLLKYNLHLPPKHPKPIIV